MKLTASILTFVFGFSMNMNQGSGQTLFGDGGYQSDPVECILEWTYKEKLSNGENLETKLSGCVSFDEFKPYPFFQDETASEIPNLLEPSDDSTSKKMWCPILRNVYNPTPLRTIENRYNWGYCLNTSPDPIPNPSPTPKPTDPPTPFPTIFPTESKEYEGGPTGTPTEPPAEAQFPAEPQAQPVPPPTDVPEPETSAPRSTTTPVVVLDVGMVAGIAVASTLLVAALIVIVVFARKLRRSEEDEIEEEADNHEPQDLEEDIKSDQIVRG